MAYGRFRALDLPTGKWKIAEDGTIDVRCANFLKEDDDNKDKILSDLGFPEYHIYRREETITEDGREMVLYLFLIPDEENGVEVIRDVV